MEVTLTGIQRLDPLALIARTCIWVVPLTEGVPEMVLEVGFNVSQLGKSFASTEVWEFNVVVIS